MVKRLLKPLNPQQLHQQTQTELNQVSHNPLGASLRGRSEGFARTEYLIPGCDGNGAWSRNSSAAVAAAVPWAQAPSWVPVGSRAQARILIPGPAVDPIFGPMVPYGIPYWIPYGIHMGSQMESHMGSHMQSIWDPICNPYGIPYEVQYGIPYRTPYGIPYGVQYWIAYVCLISGLRYMYMYFVCCSSLKELILPPIRNSSRHL